MAVRERHAARALLLTPDAELLMMHFVAPQRRVWIALGGGLLPGEGPEVGLCRELGVETGRHGWRIGPQVWTRRVTFVLAGETLRQHERYLLVPTLRFEPPAEMPDEAERRWFGGFRWWDLAAIRSSDDRFAPRRIAGCLEALLRDGPPRSPVDAGR